MDRLVVFRSRISNVVDLSPEVSPRGVLHRSRVRQASSSFKPVLSCSIVAGWKRPEPSRPIPTWKLPLLKDRASAETRRLPPTSGSFTRHPTP